MKTVQLSLLVCAALISACSLQGEQIDVPQISCRTGEVYSSLKSNVDVVSFKTLTEEKLHNLLRSQCPCKEYSIDTIYSKLSRDRRPILYIANYSKGGWAIVAAVESGENQILAYDNVGDFHLDKIQNPSICTWLDMTCNVIESLNIEDEVNENTSRSLPHWIDPNEIYYWVRLDQEPIRDTITIEKDHLITTKWGQGIPWNIRTPQPYSSVFCHTGCVAVAASQMLYYLRQYKGFSIGLYDISASFQYNSYYGYYYISSISRTNYTLDSYKWNEMATHAYSTGNTNYVSELMCDVAERDNMEFYATGSGAPANTTLFSMYGVSCNKVSYSSTHVINSLEDNMPVIILCQQGNAPSVGHAWIIDGYQRKRIRVTNSYRWTIIPTDSLMYYNNINYNYVYTESQMQLLYPDVNEGDTETTSYSYDNHLYRMNWGDDGNYDTALYSIVANWSPTSGATYNYNPQIIYNFQRINP